MSCSVVKVFKDLLLALPQPHQLVWRHHPLYFYQTALRHLAEQVVHVPGIEEEKRCQSSRLGESVEVYATPIFPLPFPIIGKHVGESPEANLSGLASDVLITGHQIEDSQFTQSIVFCISAKEEGYRISDSTVSDLSAFVLTNELTKCSRNGAGTKRTTLPMNNADQMLPMDGAV